MKKFLIGLLILWMDNIAVACSEHVEEQGIVFYSSFDVDTIVGYSKDNIEKAASCKSYINKSTFFKMLTPIEKNEIDVSGLSVKAKIDFGGMGYYATFTNNKYLIFDDDANLFILKTPKSFDKIVSSNCKYKTN